MCGDGCCACVWVPVAMCGVVCAVCGELCVMWCMVCVVCRVMCVVWCAMRVTLCVLCGVHCVMCDVRRVSCCACLAWGCVRYVLYVGVCVFFFFIPFNVCNIKGQSCQRNATNMIVEMDAHICQIII